MSAAEDRREWVESQGKSPTAEGTPLVAEEGVNEGISELLEQAPEAAETDARSRPRSPASAAEDDTR
ncbi:MAG: hypothetical protein M3088_02005 [Actinomycetota bacterium]|nr:hypothetical protein [Actinomycetota bacterium]